ncbi:MAG: CDP-glycerol glycerophosphotransferase family protein, partial [Propionibacteriaceae bacterium]|nr:CDP-glycerol glycerophosphotransferase family protein [Propionibacteriaceae bacterium]
MAAPVSERTTAGTRQPRFSGLDPVRSQLDNFLSTNLINLGAVGAACLLLATVSVPLRTAGVLAAVASFLAIVWRRRTAVLHPSGSRLLGYFVSVRAVLFVAVGAGYSLRRPDMHGWIWTAVAVAILLVLSEPLLKSLLITPRQIVVHLPGVRPVPSPPFPPAWLTTASLVNLVLGALLAAVAAPAWILLVLVLMATPPTVVTLRHAVLATVTSKRAEAKIRPALQELRPTFAVYYAALHGANYQLGMWLPYLERLNQPFVVITRNPETVPTIAKLTSAPILVPKTDNVSPSLDAMVVPSLKAAFYVQGSPANQTFQRYRQLTHIWLNHGDSDKPANFHPRHATYDKLFVSGQLGIERYARRGIDVPPERFVIVGRPQIETIESHDEPLPPATARTVLYAPTWKGGRPSTNYSSLSVGEHIVRALIERGATVIFRPHPVSYQDPEDAERIRSIHRLLEADRAASGAAAGEARSHVWGTQAEKEWDVPACFNASDALVTDVSSIATDYLASGK